MPFARSVWPFRPNGSPVTPALLRKGNSFARRLRAFRAELERVARTFIQPTSKPSTQPGDTAEDRAAARRAKALKDIDQIKADWDAERQALSKLAVTIESKQFGDNCYVIRFTGVTPDQLGAQSALNCGWLRKGNVCISVEASGNFPEQAMADAMNLFLKEIDAKFVSSDDLR